MLKVNADFVIAVLHKKLSLVLKVLSATANGQVETISHVMHVTFSIKSDLLLKKNTQYKLIMEALSHS